MSFTKLAALALIASMSAAAVVAADKAPMPQTRGMQGMDPRDHDKPPPVPYEGCTPNAEKVAVQEKHPMPQTRGMQGMDPRDHTMDCPPKADAPASDQPKHEHRSPGN
jgi:hypothetical protein